MDRTKIILDTDIGGDIDDVLALAFAMNCPELEILAVTTVNTDPPMRARIARKMLDRFDHSHVPVAPGEKDMFDGRATFCKDINAAVVLDPEDTVSDASGVELIIETIRSHPGEVVLVGIGPFTNIAAGFKKAPNLSDDIDQLILMGGQVNQAEPESNIQCDPAAASYVLNLPVRKTLLTLDATKDCPYTASQQRPLRESKDSRDGLVWDCIRAWQVGRCGGDDNAVPVLHDAAAVALVFRPDLAKDSRKAHLNIVAQYGDMNRPLTVPLGDSEPNARIVTAVHGNAFNELFLERITRGRNVSPDHAVTCE